MAALSEAYYGFEGSWEPLTVAAFSEETAKELKEMQEFVGATRIGDMDAAQMQTAERFYSRLLNTVVTADRTFREDYNQSITEIAESIQAEVAPVIMPGFLAPKVIGSKTANKLKELLWNNLKPATFFETLGSPTLTKLFDAFYKGQDTTGKDIQTAADFFGKAVNTYKAGEWDLAKLYDFQSADGKQFSLNLGQMLSLFAYSKRENAVTHLKEGGFRFKPDTPIKEKNKLEKVLNDSENYLLDDTFFSELSKKLTKEQRNFADVMQGFLSYDVAAWGNEVSMALYGYRMFGEKYYFPMLCRREYLESNTGASQGDPKVKNKGMANPVTPSAKNPLILDDFFDVWARHVNDMALYHGMVLPSEDMNRVLNYISADASKRKITAEMTDSERFDILKHKKLSLSAVTDTKKTEWIQGVFGDELQGLQAAKLVNKKKLLKKAGDEFGIFRKYKNEDVELSFGYSKTGLGESVQKQKEPTDDLLKMMSCFDAVIENAIGIEAHNRNSEGYRQAPSLLSCHVLVSVFRDGDRVVPVKLEIKEFSDKENALYVEITSEGIKEDGGVKQGTAENGETEQYSPTSEISMADFFKNITPKDESLRKYIPKDFFEKDLSGLTGERTAKTKSLKHLMEEKYGKVAVKYIEQLLIDINGGLRMENTLGILDNMLSKFKKGATMASLSVAVQQPSAIARAAAYIPPKHLFRKQSTLSYAERVALMEKYAPVAIIKKMGGFDTGTGRATADYILGREYEGADKVKAFFTDSKYRDEKLGILAAKADEITWVQMFEGCKNELLEAYNKGKNRSEQLSMEAFEKNDELMTKVGECFSYVINHTQVYDSVLSRSAHMRSRNSLTKMATAFMAEPTTVVNMAVLAAVKFARGQKGEAMKSFGAIIGSIVLNSLMASIVYALRDDDEDKSYPEKYVTNLTEGIIDGLNPMGYFPILRDMMSLLQGYDVARSDMAPIAELVKAVNSFIKGVEKNKDGEITGWEMFDRTAGFVGAVGNILGVPVKNIYRDMKAFVLTGKNALGGTKTTGAGLADAFLIGLPFTKETENGERLYRAKLSGNTAEYDRIAARFETKNDAESAMKKALREKDSRVSEAAQALLTGDEATCRRLANEIYNEGHFTKRFISEAVNSELAAMKREMEENGDVIFIGDTMYRLTADEITAMRSAREDISLRAERMKSTAGYRSLTADQKELAEDWIAGKAEDIVNCAVLGDSSKKTALLAYTLGTEQIAVFYARTKGVQSDYAHDGSVIAGSKRKKVLSAIRRLPLSTDEKLLLLMASGYSPKDGDFPGMTAETAKERTKKCILTRKGLTGEQKEKLMEYCGLMNKKADSVRLPPMTVSSCIILIGIVKKKQMKTPNKWRQIAVAFMLYSKQRRDVIWRLPSPPPRRRRKRV